MRNYYAINYWNGIAVNQDGDRYGKYFSFSSKTARDTWVGEGADFQGSSGYWEPIKASDTELRSMLRKADMLMAAGQGHEQALYEVNAKLSDQP